MVKKYYLVWGAVILAVGAFAVYHFYFNEEARVIKQFRLLGKHVAKQAEESNLVAAASINKALRLFANPIQLEIPSHSISKTYDRRELSAPLFMKRSRYSEIDLHFYDFKIEFPDAGTAQANATLVFNAKGRSGDQIQETHELMCTLVQNRHQDWIFSRIEVVEVLEK